MTRIPDATSVMLDCVRSLCSVANSSLKVTPSRQTFMEARIHDAESWWVTVASQAMMEMLCSRWPGICSSFRALLRALYLAATPAVWPVGTLASGRGAVKPSQDTDPDLWLDHEHSRAGDPPAEASL